MAETYAVSLAATLAETSSGSAMLWQG